MPFNGSGAYSAPASNWNPAVPGDSMDTTDWNALLLDMSTAFSSVICKDGQTTITANLPMSGFRFTGVGNASARDQFAAAGQVQDSTFTWGGTATGTADALTLTLAPAITAYAAGQTFRFISSSSANTGAATININSVGAATIQLNGAALTAGQIAASKLYEITYDGSNFQLRGVSAAPTVAATQLLAGTLNAGVGYSATPYNAGTKSSGTYTPATTDGNFQYAVNGGAHTLAPPAGDCTIVIQYTNNGSAGAITTSGFTKVVGTFTTTNGDDFMCAITRCNSFSLLVITALQ